MSYVIDFEIQWDFDPEARVRLFVVRRNHLESVDSIKSNEYVFIVDQRVDHWDLNFLIDPDFFFSQDFDSRLIEYCKSNGSL